jgi:hypothetical protein
MNTREASKRYRLSQWGQIFTERTSGETIDKFCERKEISKSQYFYWQRKLRKTACSELVSLQNESGEKPLVPSGWAVCEPMATGQKDDAAIIEIGKFSVRVTAGTTPGLLTKTCKVLVELC